MGPSARIYYFPLRGDTGILMNNSPELSDIQMNIFEFDLKYTDALQTKKKGIFNQLIGLNIYTDDSKAESSTNSGFWYRRYRKDRITIAFGCTYSVHVPITCSRHIDLPPKTAADKLINTDSQPSCYSLSRYSTNVWRNARIG